MRVAALAPPARRSPAAVHRALAAHLCRCTGWQPIVATVSSFDSGPIRRRPQDSPRAAIEGGARQRPAAGGDGGFADDLAPDDALVAIRGEDGDWHVGETLT